ncbi:hypothetical protein IE4872_PD00290 (plasmid) [Rhizobium gallicum]|uniref:Uncharacterized protein n=1 Tax=Rhizobium gallicum TaxID=56730 RepID=A0A1L5NSE3_9HYPH|nr:hypothetical protein IE4872_PD00290 [Rhizobium gallicum]
MHQLPGNFRPVASSPWLEPPRRFGSHTTFTQTMVRPFLAWHVRLNPLMTLPLTAASRRRFGAEPALFRETRVGVLVEIGNAHEAD